MKVRWRGTIHISYCFLTIKHSRNDQRSMLHSSGNGSTVELSFFRRVVRLRMTETFDGMEKETGKNTRFSSIPLESDAWSRAKQEKNRRFSSPFRLLLLPYFYVRQTHKTRTHTSYPCNWCRKTPRFFTSFFPGDFFETNLLQHQKKRKITKIKKHTQKNECNYPSMNSYEYLFIYILHT